jgi:transcription elongation GreA/GreB family factor
MSRAFVKEVEDQVEDFPDRPISRHRNLVTPQGLGAIEAALVHFEQALREAIAINDAQATAAARREVRYWRARHASAEVIRPPAEVDTASFGTAVKLRRDDGREQTFRIVGEDEADPANGSVSYVSPLAQAVMTCGPGDTVEIAGRKADILDVRSDPATPQSTWNPL